jgi:hypothetical protein
MKNLPNMTFREVREALSVSRSKKEQRRIAANPQHENRWMLVFSRDAELRRQLQARAEMLGLLDRKSEGFGWHLARLLQGWQRKIRVA